MKHNLMITTAVALVMATAAHAQSPNSSTTPSSSTPSTSSTPSANSQAVDPKASSSSSTTSTPPSSSPATPQQAQTAPNQSSSTTTPARAQTNTPAATPNNQAQQTPAAGNTTTTAQQPSSTNPSTAQSSSTSVSASVNVNDQQRTRVADSITRHNFQPITNVNFSVSVGTVVPRDIRLETLPTDVVEIVPQYRGYSFFVVRDEIVIVEPSTYKIVQVIQRSGNARAAAPAAAQSRVTFSDKDRDVVRKHVKTQTSRETVGSSARTVIRRGERLPESVTIEEFPDTVYRDAPALREYRYLHRDNHTYIVQPSDRTVIEEID